MATSLLQAQEISVRFAGVQALDGVSLDVGPGEIVAVIGPNGAGKTTLFNALTGFVTPTTGTVRLRGRDITSLPPAQRAALGLGRTFQQGGLWLSETALGNLLIAAHLTVDTDSPAGFLAMGGGERQRELNRVTMAEDVLGILGLAAYARVPTADMPYGSRKLLELGCALLARPEILLLDEPAAGASSEELPRLANVIRDIRARLQVAVVIIEHRVPLVRDVADRLYVLNFGQVIATGAPDDVTRDPLVIEAYLGSRASQPSHQPRRRTRRAAPSTKAGRGA